jgi:hypothetical protein
MTKAADERFKPSEARLNRPHESLKRLEQSLALPQATLSDLVDSRRAERQGNGRRRLRED